jgi:putative mycofactocin binding protein MftB
METKPETRYKLAPGSQVREEDFGLLFYTMAGPRLYFLSSGRLLDRDFFNGEFTFETWMRQNTTGDFVPKQLIQNLKNSLHQLQKKGVIIER